MVHELGLSDLRAVLVVEDSADDYDTVVEAAARAGIGNRLVRAADADATQQHLDRNPHDDFAFVLLDYNLPGMDGLTLLKSLRLQARWSHLPVVVYTTSVNPRDRDAFYAAGANAYHVKTIRYAACLQSLQGIFRYWLGHVSLPAQTLRLV